MSIGPAAPSRQQPHRHFRLTSRAVWVAVYLVAYALPMLGLMAWLALIVLWDVAQILWKFARAAAIATLSLGP